MGRTPPPRPTRESAVVKPPGVSMPRSLILHWQGSNLYRQHTEGGPKVFVGSIVRTATGWDVYVRGHREHVMNSEQAAREQLERHARTIHFGLAPDYRAIYRVRKQQQRGIYYPGQWDGL